MGNKSPEKILLIVFYGLPLLMVIIGSILLVSNYYFFIGWTMPVERGLDSEMVKIALDFIDLEIYNYVLESENYLLFQNFKSLPPQVFPAFTLVFGTVIWFLLSLGIGLVSLFNRMQFILSMIFIIFLLTLTGVNGLHIGGLNTNLPTIILMTGFVLPAVLIHTFYSHWSASKRSAIIIPIAFLTMPLLVYLGGAVSGEVLVAEHMSMVGLVVSALFMMYNGHTVISSIYVFLAKLNKGVGLKISWHISIIFFIYLLFCIFLLLKITGNFLPDIPTPPVLILLILTGILGYFETGRKIQQISQPYFRPFIGKAIYLIGFSLTVWVYWKAEFSINRPMVDFMDHFFVYSQIAFSLLFYAYLFANFSGLMNKGAQVEKILFKPRFFAYYHMRIGALLAILSLVVYADGIIAVQFGTASTNVSADYYYATQRLREASILYENSWERYRRNEKALNAVAHISISQNQPTAAINTLVRGFENAPTVNDILLLSSALQMADKHPEALAVLEKGLSYYPENPYLVNNLALLFSQQNRGEEAYRLLNQIQDQKEVARANKIGLQAKHLVHYEEAISHGDDPVARINQLALLNIKGDTADFVFNIEEINDGSSIINRAVLRNQWSNLVEGDFREEISFIDTLLTEELAPSEVEQLRETRVIRSYQQDYINESLKYINGLAFQFPNSAGFYHAMAANILIGQLDFEKAAIELDQAEVKGFRNVQTKHLPILYFGGKEARTLEIAEKYQVPFPDWMEFDSGGDLVPNDTTIFFSHLAMLHMGVKKDFLAGLNEIQGQGFKSYFAYQILLRKSHWLGEEERDFIKKEALKSSKISLLIDDLEEMIPVWGSKGADQITSMDTTLLPFRHLSASRNAYWTPMVFYAVDQSTDNLEKYNLLLEASDFNKDPLLWINLVKYSRIIGLDSYASGILGEMSQWVDPQTLEELQLQNL